MAHVITNIRRIAVKVFREFFALWRNYGFIPAFYTLVWWLNFYLPTPWRFSMSKWALLKKTVWLDRHIEKNYSDVISRYNRMDSGGKISEKIPIWVFWGQGEKSMPVLVKACYEQLKKHNCNVNLITNSNIKDYIEVPTPILEKVTCGLITWAHFSDFVRMNLLKKYGGLWIDATGWVAGSIPFEKLMNMSLYSPNGETGCRERDICFWTSLGINWSGWCLWSNHTDATVYGFVGDMLSEMIQKEKMTLDYVLVDYLIYYAVHHFPGVAEEFKKFAEIPGTNRGRLAQLMGRPFDDEEYTQLCESDFVFKLSFRTPWRGRTPDGTVTFYGKLIEKKM